MMRSGKDLVADLRDQPIPPLVEALAGVVGNGGGLFQNRKGCDHFRRHQIFADAEIFERTLGLRAPKLVGRYTDLAETVSLYAEIARGLILLIVHWCCPVRFCRLRTCRRMSYLQEVRLPTQLRWQAVERDPNRS